MSRFRPESHGFLLFLLFCFVGIAGLAGPARAGDALEMPRPRARVMAKHIDSHAWLTKREGTRYDHALRRSVPRTPPEERCPCTTWNGPQCTCGNECTCHWRENQWPPAAASGAGKGEL